MLPLHSNYGTESICYASNVAVSFEYSHMGQQLLLNTVMQHD